MPEIPDVIAGDPIESSWGNQIRDRAVMRYATTAARDSAMPTPITGDLAWITTEFEAGLDLPGIFQVHDGTNWVSLARSDGATFLNQNAVNWLNTGFTFDEGSIIADLSNAPNFRLRGRLNRGVATTETLFQLGGGAGGSNWIRNAPGGGTFAIRTATTAGRILAVSEDSALGDGSGEVTVLVADNMSGTVVDADESVSVRNIFVADRDPLAGDGENGDVWMRYT